MSGLPVLRDRAGTVTTMTDLTDHLLRLVDESGSTLTSAGAVTALQTELGCGRSEASEALLDAFDRRLLEQGEEYILQRPGR